MASRFYIFKYLQGANTELRPAHVVEEVKKTYTQGSFLH